MTSTIDITKATVCIELTYLISLSSTEPYWLLLSAAEFFLVQLFMLAAFYISRRLNEISTLEVVRRSQKRDLWA